MMTPFLRLLPLPKYPSLSEQDKAKVLVAALVPQVQRGGNLFSGVLEPTQDQILRSMTDLVQKVAEHKKCVELVSELGKVENQK